MSGRDDGDDIFSRLFAGFMGSDIDEHFREMTRQMEEMIKNFGFGDIRFQEGFPQPPVHGGGGRPPSMENPREQMLKNPDASVPSSTEDQAPSDMRHRPFSTHFRVPPFNRPSNESPLGSPQPGDRDRLSGQPEPTESVVSTWSSSWNKSFTNDGNRWNSTSVQTVQHPDGTVERIEKSTQNGRTCTTTIRTDPSGVSTSNTVCDRPAIEGPQLKDNPVTNRQNPEPKPVKTYQPNNEGYNKEDISFFKKMFGFDIFKPKD